jgi:hypothetical protein
MAHALNLTFKIKQDAETLQKLQDVKKIFASQIQPAIDAVLTSCKLVHFARILVIDDRYMMVLTEYDGDHLAYTEFFRVNLPDVFSRGGCPAVGANQQPERFFQCVESSAGPIARGIENR